MQFLVLGFDGTDSDAPDRRKSARPGHLARAQELDDAGALHFGAALIDDDGNMIGSVMVVEFNSEEELHAKWLDAEPYCLQGVWKKTEIRPIRIADSFLKR